MPEDFCVTVASWILCMLAAERATEIINESKFFAPFRNFLGQMAYRESAGIGRLVSKFFLFAHNIITCSWCLSIWVSGFFCWFLPGDYFRASAPDNILVKWLALVGLANLWHAIFRLVFNGRVLTVDVSLAITNAEEGQDDDLDEQDDEQGSVLDDLSVVGIKLESGDGRNQSDRSGDVEEEGGPGQGS